MKLATALNRALKNLPSQPHDLAAIELARKYAGLIDGVNVPDRIVNRLVAVLVDEFGMTGKRAWELVDHIYEDHTEKLGPRFLETLVELGMTPKARNAVMKGGA